MTVSYLTVMSCLRLGSLVKIVLCGREMKSSRGRLDGLGKSEMPTNV